MENVCQSDSPNVKKEDKKKNIEMIIIKCRSDDYLTCFSNCIKYTTQEAGKIFSIKSYINLYKECEFDMEHHIDIAEYLAQFQQVYNGFYRKYDSGLTKINRNGKGKAVYGPEAFYSVIESHLTDEDYYFPQKRQNIQIEEYMYILFLITEKYLQYGGAVILNSNYFLCMKNKNGYHKFTHRTINKHKLIYIVNVLQKYEFISKRLVGIKKVKHLRCSYTLDVNNPYYKKVKQDGG